MLASTARFNASLTARAYKLVAAVTVRAIPEQVEAHEQAQAEGRYAMTPNWEVLGECGHRLTVVRASEAPAWQAKITAKKRHRKRCEDCIVDPAAHAARLL